MKRLRDPNRALSVLFVAIIFAVPLIQAVIEAPQEDGVRAFEVFSETPTAANLRNYEQNLEKASWAGKLARPWLQYAHFAWLKDGGEKVVLGAHDWYFYKPGLKYMVARPDPAQQGSGTNDPVGAIVHFRDQLATWGIQLLVMPVPNKDSIYPDFLTSRAESSPGVISPRTREVLDRLRAAKVEVVDLFTEFGKARRVNETTEALYLAQDTHWSPAGVALAARVVAQRLTELGWVRRGATEYTERPAAVRRLGDILRMMQVPQVERSVTPENVSTVQVVRHDKNQLYKDEAEAEILVLGDSFMRIYEQDEPGAAGFIAHLAKEMKQPLMSLVNDGGGSTLVREELSGRPIFLKNKKVVIWEFVERDIGLGIKGWKRIDLPPPPRESPGPLPPREKTVTLADD